jgi:monofunctional glycosyltransferase
MDAAKWITGMMKKLSLLTSIFFFLVSAVALVTVAAVATLMLLPDVRDLEKCFITSMYAVHLCPNSENYVRLKDISPFLIHAVIAAEDGSFYSHEGFDWHEMEESFNQDLRTGHIARGGSTLTQQLAKNAFLGKEKSLWRKLKEAYLAHAIEKHYTKDFILEKYLNVVEFGENLYGVKAAALKYFHKSASQLNPLESAFLALLLPNPKVYSKSIRSGKLTPYAHKMVITILRRMNSFGKLSAAAYQTAMIQLPNFPWQGLSLDVFQGPPSYNLDASTPQGDIGVDPNADEAALEEIVKEDEGSAKEAKAAEAPAVSEDAVPDKEPSESN